MTQLSDVRETTGPAWVPPDPVAPLTGDQVSDRLRSWSRLLGFRVPGWIMLGAGVVLIVVGSVLRWTELWAGGALALLLVAVGALFTLGRPQLAVEVGVPVRHVRVGDAADGRLVVVNAGARRTLPSRLIVPVGDHRASLVLPSLGVGAEHRAAFRIPTRHRGVVAIGPVHSVQGDPFGLMGRDYPWTDVVEVFVHPRTVALPGRRTGFVHDLEGHPTPKLSQSDISFHALREYVPGDDRRHIHWRSSARTGQLMVRQYEETRQSRVAVVLDLADNAYAGDDEFEDAVSVAASFVTQAIRDENPVALVTNVDSYPALSLTRIMNQFSRLERHANTHVTDAARMLRDREANASVVILITGSRNPLDRIRHAATLLDLDARVIAIRIAPGPQIVETVANTSVLQFHALDDLPPAVRRASL